MLKHKSYPYWFIGGLCLMAQFASLVRGGQSKPAADPAAGWLSVPFAYEIQHPYDLKAADRYDFDATNGIHHFWINFTDKPHAPPPNKTNARSEMRWQAYTNGVYMFDGDVNIRPNTSACIGQILDATRGPITMVIANPDGTITVHVHDLPELNDLILTNATGHWWNLKIENDTNPGGKVRVYIDNRLAGTYPGRGPREYYFKCGVYSRENSSRSEVYYRNLKQWRKPE